MKYTLAHIYPNFPKRLKELEQSLTDGHLSAEEYRRGKELIIKNALNIKKWHIEYSFENPNTFERDRIKVYEDVNRRSGDEKVAYAILLRDAVNVALASGYDPFKEEEMVISDRRENYTIERAMDYYLAEKKKQGKADSSIARFTTATNYFRDWLELEGLLHKRASEITAAQILRYLDEYSVAKDWTGHTYNNHLNNMHNLFNLLSKGIHGIVPKNPIQGADQRSVVVHKHAAYTDKQLKDILDAVRKKGDKNLEGVILSCYYACIRSREEMRNVQAKDILFERDLIRMDGEDAKGRRDDFIPLDPELKAFYIEQGFHNVPGDYYLFSSSRSAGPKMAGYHLYAVDFREYRDTLKIDDRYTLYGFKHTRNVHLGEAGVDPYALMQLNRHTSLEQTMKYLRDLGVTINRKATENSRKI